jgi:transposase
MDREYIGVDLHKAFFQACALTATGERSWEGRFPRTPDGIARFVARGVDARRAIAVEASGPTWAFVDALAPTGATVCVVDPRKTKLKAGVAAKTDRLDARRLADALRRESVVSIYIPPPELRELREMCRGRHQVVRLRTRLAQMIRALLLRCDAGEPPGTRLYSPRALAWLAAVELGPESTRTLRRLERLYREVHTDAHAVDAELKQRAAADPIAVALTAMTGVGPVVAVTLRAEIGDITRFRRGSELACYAGLVPRVEQSANRRYHGRITRNGSPWLRWALVEAAMHAVKRPDATGRWARRLAVRTGAMKARVALARVLCDEVIAAWPRPA